MMEHEIGRACEGFFVDRAEEAQSSNESFASRIKQVAWAYDIDCLVVEYQATKVDGRHLGYGLAYGCGDEERGSANKGREN